VETSYDREVLKQLVLAKYLSGITGSGSIATALKAPELQPAIQRLMDTQEFMSLVRGAKRDMATSVIDSIKARLHEFREAMETLALMPGDPRVQFQALKDLLDRGGTGAAKQISLTSPAAYKKALDEFKEDGDEKTPDPATDSGTTA
jgi:hypothetical protein